MERQRFVHEFVLLFLLVIAVGIIALQSNLNFTGYVSLDGCDGDWTCEEWGVCAESSQTRTCTLVETSTSSCETPITQTQACTLPVCDATHLDLCDVTTCVTGIGFWYNDLCNADEEVVEVIEEDEEEEEDGNETTTDNTPSTTLITPNAEVVVATPEVTAPLCYPDWQCGDWQECIEGTQARVCTDINTCETQEGMPETSQTCVVAITETCSDGIKNQDETGVDCGGVCKKCSFFTIVGSVINGPLDAGKDFVFKEIFGNTTKTIIAIGSLVLVIGGIVCFKIFKKKKSK